MTRHVRVAGLVAAVVLLGACGGTAGDQPPDPTVDREPDEVAGGGGGGESDSGGSEPDDAPAQGSEPLLGDEVSAAIDDVTDRAGVARDDVLVEVTELVTWPDSSLGCPEPDQLYTQALVEGYRIVLDADGEEHHYHGEDDGPPQFCADPQPPASTES